VPLTGKIDPGCVKTATPDVIRELGFPREMRGIG